MRVARNAGRRAGGLLRSLAVGVVALLAVLPSWGCSSDGAPEDGVPACELSRYELRKYIESVWLPRLDEWCPPPLDEAALSVPLVPADQPPNIPAGACAGFRTPWLVVSPEGVRVGETLVSSAPDVADAVRKRGAGPCVIVAATPDAPGRLLDALVRGLRAAEVRAVYFAFAVAPGERPIEPASLATLREEAQKDGYPPGVHACVRREEPLGCIGDIDADTFQCWVKRHYRAAFDACPLLKFRGLSLASVRPSQQGAVAAAYWAPALRACGCGEDEERFLALLHFANVPRYLFHFHGVRLTDGGPPLVDSPDTSWQEAAPQVLERDAVGAGTAATAR